MMFLILEWNSNIFIFLWFSNGIRLFHFFFIIKLNYMIFIIFVILCWTYSIFMIFVILSLDFWYFHDFSRFSFGIIRCSMIFVVLNLNSTAFMISMDLTWISMIVMISYVSDWIVGFSWFFWFSNVIFGFCRFS